MIVSTYLVVTKTGSVTVRSRPPALAGNEIGVHIELDVPSELFQRPILEAKMKIPTEAVPRVKITPQITDNVQKIIKEATGLNMVVSIVEQPKEDGKPLPR